MAVDTGLDIGKRLMGKASHMCAGRFVADHQRVGLRPMNQAHGDAGIGGMEQRALALDQIPMIGVVGRTQPFGGA